MIPMWLLSAEGAGMVVLRPGGEQQHAQETLLTPDKDKNRNDPRWNLMWNQRQTTLKSLSMKNMKVEVGFV